MHGAQAGYADHHPMRGLRPIGGRLAEDAQLDVGVLAGRRSGERAVTRNPVRALPEFAVTREVTEEAVVRYFRTTGPDGKCYEVAHYNLDMVIALGFRVRSAAAVRFRQWALTS
jgi:hypothetical protein